MKTFLLSCFLCISAILTAQNESGYWDVERSTRREIKLCAGCKTWIRSDELPIGTTEVIYRITLLDENQQLTNSLVSLLSSIPDPSGIGQGSAGALHLLSKVAGSDKCKFTIFNSYDHAVNYTKTGVYQTGCYIHPNEINTWASRLTINSSCLANNQRYFWFGFKSSNAFMDEKIVVEIVPWVDKTASRGWTKELKQSFLDDCISNANADGDIANPKLVCGCLLDKIQAKYKLQDFQQMTSSEIDKIVNVLGEECFEETGENEASFEQKRNDALAYAKKGDYVNAVYLLTEVIEKSNPTAMDYNNLGFYLLFTKQYLKAIKYLKLGEQIDETELLIKGNLAHAYLFNGDIELAKIIYLKYKNQNATATLSWIKMVEDDFKLFKKFGLPTEGFDEILKSIGSTLQINNNQPNNIPTKQPIEEQRILRN